MDNTIKKSSKVTPALLRIANTILCNYSMVGSNNLVNGKMGVCLFLYEYARLTGLKEYEDIADDMIDLILKVLHKGQNEEDISNLSGIGIGVTYLITHNFLEDTDEHDSLEEVDLFLQKTIETAKVPSEMVTQSAFYFIYRFLHYRGGIERKCYNKLAKQLLKLFQDYEDKSREDIIILNFILQNVKQIYINSQNDENFLNVSTSPYELILDYDLKPITAEKMWYDFLYNRTLFKSVTNEETLLSLCQNCFYDPEHTVGLLCAIGLMEIVNNYNSGLQKSAGSFIDGLYNNKSLI